MHSNLPGGQRPSRLARPPGSQYADRTRFSSAGLLRRGHPIMTMRSDASRAFGPARPGMYGPVGGVPSSPGMVIKPETAEDGELTRQAFLAFWKGRHKAGLNFGDCFCYSLAKATGEPLVFKRPILARPISLAAQQSFSEKLERAIQIERATLTLPRLLSERRQSVRWPPTLCRMPNQRAFSTSRSSERRRFHALIVSQLLPFCLQTVLDDKLEAKPTQANEREREQAVAVPFEAESWRGRVWSQLLAL